MKQKILIVDAKIRKMVENENEEQYLKHSSKLGYKVGIALTFVLVIAWPIPLYLSRYVFSHQVYSAWVGIAVMWAGAAATVIIMLPLIESRRGIIEVLRKIGQGRKQQQESNGFNLTDNSERIIVPHSNSTHRGANSAQGCYQKKILVPFDGSPQSLRALYSAANMYANSLNTESTVLHSTHNRMD